MSVDHPMIANTLLIGKDSFFEAHKDTPRGTDMLGLLVRRHKGREWALDAVS